MQKTKGLLPRMTEIGHFASAPAPDPRLQNARLRTPGTPEQAGVEWSDSGSVSVAMGELVDRDQEHLFLLKLGHYILSGATAFISLFALFYVGLGAVLTPVVFPCKP